MYQAIRFLETAPAMPAKGSYAEVNGLKMYYEIHGSGGHPLVLLHGAYSSIESSFGSLIPELAKTRQVIAVELQGHGRTADIDRPLSCQQLADDVAGLLRQLNIGQADVFGYSLGGGVGLQMAIRHPESVRKLAVASVNYTSDGAYPEVAAFMDQVTPELFADTPVLEEYKRVNPKPEAFPELVKKLNQMNALKQDWTEGVRTIKAPVLTIIGDSDNVRPDHAVEMFRLLGGGVAGDLAGLPNAQLAVFPGTTHYTMISRTHLLLAAVVPFLDAEASKPESSPTK
ncbi:alpha/beta hydrolase [Paenibacillus sp. CC-CFT747]|nr:alpha/beta hydrolase [Paenibacillus sp. CC-CFT747]